MLSTPPADATQRAALYAQALTMSQQYDLQTPTSRLGQMGWFSKTFGNNFYRNPNAGWGLHGLSNPGGLDEDWNTEDPQFVVLARDDSARLRRIRRLAERGGKLGLANKARAQRWGTSLFILGHELGHDRTPSLDEGDANRYAIDHFQHLGRQLGLNKHQVRRILRASNNFRGVNTSPE